MLHPRLTSVDGTQTLWLAQIGSWGDLTYRTRWGQGACGMFEASWTMALPSDFEHPLLRLGTLVELMDGTYRVGSPLVMTEPAVGAGFQQPWTITCTGIGREVEGENSFFALDSGGDTTSIPSTAADQAIADGWRIAGRLVSVPTSAVGGTPVTDELMTCGSLFNAAGDSAGTRWGVNSDNYLFFGADPTTPTYHVTPDAVALGSSGDSYASTVLVRYHDSTSGVYDTVSATDARTESRFGAKFYAAPLIEMGPMSAATAQGFADGILAKVKGRLGWTNGFTLTSNQILTAGGASADLSILAEDVGKGCMVRVHGIWSDLLEFTGETWLDLVLGEAVLVDGAQTIGLSPAGLAPRDFAAVIESVTGYKDAA